MNTMWGIHNDALGAELVEKSFVSIGWEEIPDLRTIGGDRSLLKDVVRRTYPHIKPGAVPVWAGTLYRFGFEMQKGDLIVAPYRPDSTLNFGLVDGDYQYRSDVSRHPHRRKVRWLRTGVARGLFPQAALYEIGSAVTLFQVRKHADIFRQFLETSSEEVFEKATTPSIVPEDDSSTTVEDEPNADRIEQHTRDFIVGVLLRELSHEEFEHFTADLLRSMGYQARVTAFSADGGVDVIAHKDPLGLEPPLIKVQCKHSTSTQSRPDVQRLIGTLSSGEVGLFVTLGTFSKDAVDLERERQNLRLFGGADITRLTLQNYDQLPARWRQLLPLRPLLVVDRPPESQ
ncbi:restriction endonuclease [Aeromicrobium sp. Root344]|uniref:restriction endonuclease n=1 Tax=Aeromicrobium sp. Root344 TaxID=1736521 RepID=UPI0006FA6574|nr:restriction endonuclease [Aeromicrobium sp. Root344]KQV75772.1 restriction endonuclease [Aeromicrobium sp. Root344]